MHPAYGAGHATVAGACVTILKAYFDTSAVLVKRGGEVFVPRIPSMNIMDLARAIGPECETDTIGIRPGEKLHECLIPPDEARYALEFDDHYVIEPSFHDWSADLLERPGGKRCAEDFTYTSDTNTSWLSVEQLREMIRFVEPDLDAAE